ncbi:MAG: ABC transporter permease [Rhabdochlamydiaceae bacterium]|nr:ABC transporter permease [Candidatus Amphrikana amoebophyrae]
MNMKLAFRNLFRNFRRTFAILLTVGLGAAALFSFQGFIKGVLGDYKETVIHAHNGHGQISMKGYRESVYEKPWEHWIDDPENLTQYLEDEEIVEHVFPRVSFEALLKHDKVSIAGHGEGVEAIKEAGFFHALNVDQGKQITTEEDGILLGKGLAKALHADIGDTVEILTRNVRGGAGKGKFVVTGIFNTGMVDFDGRMFRIQLAAAQSMLRTNSVENVAVALKDESNWTPLVEKLKHRFPQMETADYALIDKVYYQNSVDWLHSQYHIVQIIILSMVLLGIFNTISTSVLERKQEIGNLRANGESMFSVVRLIVFEGAFMGVIGCVAGIALSYIVFSFCLGDGILMPPGPGSTLPAYAQFEFTWKMVGLTSGLSIISSIVASTFAGMKVARMPIATALRSV